MTTVPVLPAIPAQRLTAPRTDGEILSVPPLQQGLALALRNAEFLNASQITLAGRPLREFRRWTRQTCLQASQQWMNDQLGIERSAKESGLLLVTGHQPQFNHSGVWMKNAAVAHMANCCHGISLNLIVDNDLILTGAVRCPAGTREEPRFEEIPYDSTQAAQPWEERIVQDRGLLESFAERVRQAMQPWGVEPALDLFWPETLERTRKCDHLWKILSVGRILHEQISGIQNLELPVSQLCQTEPFLAFVAHLCRDAEEFAAQYNQAVQAYRRRYRIRNDRHPVPELDHDNNRWELPFWYWHPGASDRMRLFVEKKDGSIELFAGNEFLTVLTDPETDIATLRALQQSGRLRTRALTTTLFARLCLGDLFVHGIGGARYDEITDALMTSYFGIQPPGYMTLTATLHLPLNADEHTTQNLGALEHSVRELEFNADRVLTGPRVEELREARNALVAAAHAERNEHLTKSQRRARRSAARARHLELVKIRRELAELANEQRRQKLDELEKARQAVRVNQVLRSREFATCLFPQDKLQTLIADLRRRICGKRLESLSSLNRQSPHV